MALIYNTLRWRVARSRALTRDGNRCTVSRLLGGECSASLDVHHIHPVSEGGDPFDLSNLATACDSHHPVWENLRRRLLADLDRAEAEDRPPRCRHRHPTADARAACDARLEREWRRRRSIAA